MDALRSIYAFVWEGLDPRVAYGVSSRLVAAVCMIAFSSWVPQITAWHGSRGLYPRVNYRKSLAKLPLFTRLWYFPDFFAFIHSDPFLVASMVAGVVAAAAIVVGGPWTPMCFFLLFMLSRSVEFYYPWETLLTELTFLMAFLPPLKCLIQDGVHPLRDLSLSAFGTTSEPSALLKLMFRLLVFRLMFGFGRIKFFGSETSGRDSLYNKYFFMNQPIPSPIAFLGYHLLPDSAHRASLWLLYVTELLAPFCYFVPGPLRAISGSLNVVLMLSIQIGGNFGFFNFLTSFMSVCLLDVRSTIFSDFSLESALSTSHMGGLPATLLFCYTVVAAPFLLVASCWATYSIPYWSCFDKAPAWFRAYLWPLRFLGQFHIVSGYGVFPPFSAAPQRISCVFEGSDDGVNWKRYQYKYQVSDPKSKPCFVAPHHPRIDHSVFYDSYGTNRALCVPVNRSDAYNWTTWPEGLRIMARLLEGASNPVSQMFQQPTPFPDPNKPPKFVRASLYRHLPTSLKHAWKTGEYWSETRLGLCWPARTIESNCLPFAEYPPEANLLPFDLTFWRARFPMTPVSREGYDRVWAFVKRVREGANSHADGRFSEWVPSNRPMPLSVAKQLLTWNSLVKVVSDLRRTSTPKELQVLLDDVSKVTTIVFDHLKALYFRPCPDKAGLKAEIQAVRQHREPVDEAWSTLWPELYMRLAEVAFTAPDNKSQSGLAGTTFHLGLLSYALVLCGGRELCERTVGGKERFFNLPAIGPSAVPKDRIAAVFRDSNTTEWTVFDIDKTADFEVLFFFFAVLHYDICARDSSKQALFKVLIDRNRVEEADHLARGGLLSGASDIMPLLPVLPAWDDSANAMVPYLDRELECWKCSADGHLTRQCLPGGGKSPHPQAIPVPSELPDVDSSHESRVRTRRRMR